MLILDIIYVLLVAAGLAVALWLSVYAWQRRPSNGASSFAALMIVISIWLTALLFFLFTESESWAVFLYNLQISCVSITPVIFYIFVFHYTGLLNRNILIKIIPILIIPLISQIFIWSGRMLISIVFVKSARILTVESWTESSFFIIHTIYTYALSIASVIILITVVRRNMPHYKDRVRGVYMSVSAVLVINLVYTIHLIPLEYNLAPLSFVVMALFLSRSVFKHDLLDIAPVARNKLIELMKEGMIVLDSNNNIIDYNFNVISMFDFVDEIRIGDSIEKLFSECPEISSLFVSQGSTPHTGLALHKERYYAFSFTPVANGRKQTSAGELIVIRDVTEDKEYQMKLERLAREKELLHHELQHRVKNNLNIIHNLLCLESVKLNDQESKKVFQGAISRIRSMAEIYEMLNKNPETEHLSLGDYIHNFAESLFNMYVVDKTRISIDFDIYEVEIELDKAAPVGLILNELITNALKYAFPQNRKGKISIILKSSEENAILTVSDDGIGISKENDVSPGFGSTLIEMLTNQIFGTFSVSPVKDGGLSATLTVPLKRA